MIYLYAFAPLWGAEVDISPFVTKVDVYLRLAPELTAQAGPVLDGVIHGSARKLPYIVDKA